MTPKEKAIELIHKFRMKRYEGILIPANVDMEREKRMDKVGAELALIAVNEIINLLNTLAKPEYVAFYVKDVYTIADTEYETHAHGYELIEYWQQVKEEINNL